MDAAMPNAMMLVFLALCVPRLAAAEAMTVHVVIQYFPSFHFTVLASSSFSADILL